MTSVAAVSTFVAARTDRQKRWLGFGAGLFTAMSLPPWGWWPLGIAGLAFIYILLQNTPSPRVQIGLYWVSMVGFFVPGLAWMIDLTPPGYVVSVPILAMLMAAPMALNRPGPTMVIAFPSALLVGEAWHWVVPFGGVPMASLAMGQVGGPLLPVARAFGALGVIAVIGLAAAALGEAAAKRYLTTAAAVAVIIVAVIVGHLAPDGTVTGTEQVAVVQGGGELGTRAVNSSASSVFEKHLAATTEVEPGSLVVWPESSLATDAPFEDSAELDRLRELAADRDITIIAGITERLDADYFSNGAIVVTSDGELLDRYDKVHLVPFGEYIPLRGFVENFADLSLIPRTAIAGDGDARLETPNGPVAAVISFEVYFGERTRDGVRNGGEIIVNPTLASSYRTTHIPEQSLASARLRAVETGRWVLQSSTTGYSAIVKSDGTVIARTGLREARVLSATAERRTGLTWPVRSGKIPLTALAIVLLLAARVMNVRAALSPAEPEG